ncbi:MAG: hypothetical protein J6I61_06945 [Prevotella sp.]|nr:hypothetical protein [Prevotella sp.]
MKYILQILLALMPFCVTAQNPYLPLWEHVPDGEPRVFEDPDHPGKFRAYIIGSHDTHNSKYCGLDIHMWSAPVEDLSQWREEGAIFSYFVDGQWDTMYAPDMVETVDKTTGKKTYWLFPHSRGDGRVGMVCRSDRPTGPFTPVNLRSDGRKTVKNSPFNFDPAAYVEPVTDPSDPDYQRGYRAYGYYGFKGSTGFQLDPEKMYGVREGTEQIHPFVSDDFKFFEASSLRKVGNKYVFIYSGYSGSEYGFGDSNSTLRYAYADSPLGPWTQGGVLVDSRGIVTSDDGSHLIATATGHNTHGSILEINGQWYVFYHRSPRNFGYARQGLVAPIRVTWDKKPVAKGGKVTITGETTYRAADGKEYLGAEVTSEGFQLFGLPPYQYYSAGIACYLTDQGWLQDNFDVWDNGMMLKGIPNGGVVGFKYFGFGGLQQDAKGVRAFRGTQKGDGTMLNLFLKPRTSKAFRIHVKLGQKEIAVVEIPAQSERTVKPYQAAVPAVEGLKGKHPIYLVAEGDGERALFDLYGIGFSRHGEECHQPEVPTVSITVDGIPLILPEQPLFANSENGITKTNRYQTRCPLRDGSVIKVERSKVKGQRSKVKVEVSPIIDGRASVRCTYQGQEKIYLIN